MREGHAHMTKRTPNACAPQALAVGPESGMDVEAAAAARAGGAAGLERRIAVRDEHHPFEGVADERLERGAQPGEIAG